jgi:hypothetical protein
MSHTPMGLHGLLQGSFTFTFIATPVFIRQALIQSFFIGFYLQADYNLMRSLESCPAVILSLLILLLLLIVTLSNSVERSPCLEVNSCSAA